MANCSYCDSFILFGGASDNTGRYCNDKCQQAGHLLHISQRIPADKMDSWLAQVHQGECPRCHGPGPVDVHKAYRVWSAVFLTSWSTNPEMSCKRCARMRQIGATCFSGLLGWWGFPWGLVMTPVQVIRNIVDMIDGPPANRPSPLLMKYVRMQAAALVLAASKTPSNSVPPPVANAATPPLVPQDDTRYQPK
jgi:hypothetical protein